jgi:hypothetical protein
VARETALTVRLYQPHARALTADGGLDVADVGHHRVRRLDPDGLVTTVAGTGLTGYSGESAPATDAQLTDPWGITTAPDGRLLGAVMSHSMDHARGVKISQCVQDARDHVCVNLVVDDSYDEDSQRALERDLRKRLGQEMTIDIQIVPQLEKRPGGKTPFILSKIGHHYA